MAKDPIKMIAVVQLDQTKILHHQLLDKLQQHKTQALTQHLHHKKLHPLKMKPLKIIHLLYQLQVVLSKSNIQLRLLTNLGMLLDNLAFSQCF